MGSNPQADNIAKYVKWIGGFVLLGFFSTFIFSALEGLAALIVFVAVAFTTVMLLPWFSLMIANLALRLFVGEVANNPILSMKNLKLTLSKEAEGKRQDILDFDTALRDFKQQLKEIKKNYPDEAADYQRMADEEDEALVQMRDEYNQALRDLDALQMEIDKQEMLYKMACAALRVSKMNKSQQTQFYRKLQKDTAIAAVQSKVNRSFASLNASVMERKGRTLALPEPTASARELTEYRGVKTGTMVK